MRAVQREEVERLVSELHEKEKVIQWTQDVKMLEVGRAQPGPRVIIIGCHSVAGASWLIPNGFV